MHRDSADDGRCAGERDASITPLEQALLLVTASHVRHAEARDDLLHWRLAPYIDAVLAAPTSCFAAQATAMQARARHEAERPRVRERALHAFQTLRSCLLVRAPASFNA